MSPGSSFSGPYGASSFTGALGCRATTGGSAAPAAAPAAPAAGGARAAAEPDAPPGAPAASVSRGDRVVPRGVFEHAFGTQPLAERLLERRVRHTLRLLERLARHSNPDAKGIEAALFEGAVGVVCRAARVLLVATKPLGHVVELLS